MKEFTYTITDPQGIHARPAGLAVKEAKKFESKITIEKGSKKGDLKKIFTVMALGVKQGEEIKVTVDGSDEEHAVHEIENSLKKISKGGIHAGCKGKIGFFRHYDGSPCFVP